MRNVIKQILEKFACKHDWYVHEETHVMTDWGESYYRQTLICRKCGKIKSIKL